MPECSYSLAGFSKYAVDGALDAIADAGFSCIELAGVGTSFSDWHLAPGDDVPVPPTGRAAADFRGQLGLAKAALLAKHSDLTCQKQVQRFIRVGMPVFAVPQPFPQSLTQAPLLPHVDTSASRDLVGSLLVVLLPSSKRSLGPIFDLVPPRR